MKTCKSVTILLLEIIGTVSAIAVEFGAPFSSHAVLQRDAVYNIWGSAKAGSTVKLEIANSDASLLFSAETISDSSGTWTVELPKISSCGPCSIGLIAISPDGFAETSMIDDILFGDVWICCDQTNSGIPLIKKENNDETSAVLSTLSKKSIRFFSVPKSSSLTAEKEFATSASWSICNPDSLRTVSHIGYNFAKLISSETKIPLGILTIAQNNTPIDSWISRESLSTIPTPTLRSRLLTHKMAVDEWLLNGKPLLEQVRKEWRMLCDPFLGKASQPSHPDFNDSEWSSVSVPSQNTFIGQVQYRRTFVLSKAQATGSGSISLGQIDESDTTFLNNTIIGETYGRLTERDYKIPNGVLKTGKNAICIRSENTEQVGGFVSMDPGKIVLTCADGSKINMSGEWTEYKYPFLSPPPKIERAPDSSDNPSTCFNAMISPLSSFAVKGVILFQDCEYTITPQNYQTLLETLIRDWRSTLRGQDIHFYIAQISSLGDTHPNPFESRLASIRWAQTCAVANTPNCEIVTTLDKDNQGNIQPNDKKNIAERLAGAALKMTYGNENSGRESLCPRPESAKIGQTNKDNEYIVRIRFVNPGYSMRTSDGAPVCGLEISDADGRFTRVTGIASGNYVDIHTSFIPGRVRYAWDDNPICNLVNSEGLPCGSFDIGLESISSPFDDDFVMNKPEHSDESF